MLRPPPLRTVRASCPAHGSSLCRLIPDLLMVPMMTPPMQEAQVPPVVPAALVARLDVMPVHLSLSRLNHWLPRCEANPEVMQGTADFHHDIPDAVLPQADPIFDDTATLDAAVDMLNPQPAGVERLVGSLLRR